MGNNSLSGSSGVQKVTASPPIYMLSQGKFDPSLFSGGAPDGHLDYSNATLFFALPWTQLESNNYTPEILVAYGLTHFSTAEYHPAYPVTSWGSTSIRGYTEGIKTIAGAMGFSSASLPFTNQLVKSYTQVLFNTGNSHNITVTDLPPMDVTLVVPDSYNGDFYYIWLKGLKIVDSNQLFFNVDQPQPTQQLSFICAGITILE